MAITASKCASDSSSTAMIRELLSEKFMVATHVRIDVSVATGDVK
jgi:hypothetical protein